MANAQDALPDRLPAQLPSGSERLEARLTKLETILDAVLPTLATKVDVAEIKMDLIKVTLAGLAIAVGILMFAINRSSPAQPPAANTQPIVIYAQPVLAQPAAASAK
jgi:hypothetical protein